MSGGQPPVTLAGPPASQAFTEILDEVFAGRSVRLLGQERLKTNVHRLRADVGGAERSLIVKWSDPVAAHRNWLLARRWLPAVGLEDHGPPLLAVAGSAGCAAGAWQVYDDLGGRPLATKPPVKSEVEAALGEIARVHTAFAEHPLLAECRHWGGDRGIQFFSSNLRDAVIALRSTWLDGLGRKALAARDSLLERIDRMKQEESERSQVLASSGGPETLLHGDLWPTNAIVVPNLDEQAVRVHLIDWDKAAVGPAGYDVSTILLRFDRSDRRWLLDAYRRAVGRRAPWDASGDRHLNSIFETAAYARLASLLVWSVAAASEGDPHWLPGRLASMVDWFDEVEPVLPPQ